MTSMFTKEDLEKNKHVANVFSRMLTHEYYKVGRLVDTFTISTLIDKISKAHFEVVKFLPKSNLYLIRTNDLGFGYSSYLSPARLHELIELGKVPKDIPIDFVYQYGNVFTYIDMDDIDPAILLSDEIYLVVKMETKQIYYAVIGRPTSPNILYYKSDYSGFRSTLDKARTIPNFNRLDIREKTIADFI